jgi:hypothetical protein
MAITIPESPTFTDPKGGLTDTTLHSEAWSMLNAKYADAGSWAAWCVNILNTVMTEEATLMSAADIGDKINALVTALDGITIPTVRDLTIDYTSKSFADSANTTFTALGSKLSASNNTFSSGLGESIETQMMARETARVSAITAKYYTEVTAVFSARGFDIPPGALAAKQSEASVESNLRLTDASGKILEETTRLALDYNKHILTIAVQFQDILARVYDSNEMRTFEAAKLTATLVIENYKAQLSQITTHADLLFKAGDLSITELNKQLALELETIRGVASGAMQMIASAMNGVTASTSFGYGGSANTSYVGV